MSDNIIYAIKTEKRTFYQDFEFQTPTYLTYKLLDLETKEEQLKVIYDYMCTVFTDLEYMEIIYSRIVETLSNPDVTLDYL